MECYEIFRDFSLSEELTALVRVNPNKQSRLDVRVSLGTVRSEFPLSFSMLINENSKFKSQFGEGADLSFYLSAANLGTNTPVITDFFEEKYYYSNLYCLKNKMKIQKTNEGYILVDEDGNSTEYTAGMKLPCCIRQGYHENDSQSGISYFFQYENNYLKQIAASDGRIVTFERDSSMFTSVITFRNEIGEMLRLINIHYINEKISSIEILDRKGLILSFTFLRNDGEFEIRDNVQNVSSAFYINEDNNVFSAVKKNNGIEEKSTRHFFVFKDKRFIEKKGNGASIIHTIFNKYVHESYDSQGFFEYDIYTQKKVFVFVPHP